MFTKALVPLDGTDVSEGIVPFITQLARGLDLGVVLAAAIDIEPALDLPNVAGSAMTNRVQERLEELADRLALEGIAADTSTGSGPASDSILRMAQDSGCDLIAMSTRGRGVVSSGLLGSVTYKIMHESPIPVLAITPERAKRHWESDYGIREIIVPLDGSELAEAALPYAAAIAARMDMRMTLLRVLPVDHVYTEGAGYHLVDEWTSALAEMESEARSYLVAKARRLRVEGIEVEVETVRGRPSTEIAELARRSDHNMIALATHGRTGVSRLLMGSVAEAVVRESGDPVLIVRPPAVATPDTVRAAVPST
ncbi:MAG: universal stress protein [Dehalococcoidia bacterium]|nr:universal stress protein [Dehalococcoidia bacterium]